METIFNGIRYPKCQPSDCHALAIHSWIYHSICVFNSPRIFSWILKWAIVYAIRYQYALQIVQAFQAFLFSVFFLSWMNSQLIFESHIFSLVDIFKINDGIFPHWNNGFFSMFSFIFFLILLQCIFWYHILESVFGEYICHEWNSWTNRWVQR